MAAKTITYKKLLNEISPCLKEVANISYPKGTPISHHISIAENLELVAGKEKLFWDTRNKMLETFSEKDEKGEAKKIVNEDTKETEYDISDENRIAFSEKLDELNNEKVKINFKTLDKKHFEGAEGLKPSLLFGLLSILK